MNRREFCLTTGLLMAAPVFGAAAVLRSDTRTVCFRAKKMFPESWATGVVPGDSLHTASVVQNQLNAIRNGGCDGVILVPGHHAGSEWMKRIKSEANRLELEVFVPAQLTRDFLRKAQTVVPLVHEEGIYQSCGKRTANEGGFLLLNTADNVFGLVLYDASRCRWTGYALSHIGVVQEAELCDQDAKLTAARWLDFTRRSFS
jgi:hypothetical protein